MRYFYDRAARPPAFESLTQCYVFPGNEPGRDAVAYQTGQVAAAVQRNADLVTTAPTASDFLYQTPWVSFAAAAVPFLQTAAPITMSLPVIYVPQWSLAGTAISTLAADLAGQATTWFGTTAAIQQHAGDMHVVDLSIFATADAALTRPLVETPRLTVPLA
jgi:hypothetical protein